MKFCALSDRVLLNRVLLNYCTTAQYACFISTPASTFCWRYGDTELILILVTQCDCLHTAMHWYLNKRIQKSLSTIHQLLITVEYSRTLLSALLQTTSPLCTVHNRLSYIQLHYKITFQQLIKRFQSIHKLQRQFALKELKKQCFSILQSIKNDY